MRGQDIQRFCVKTGKGKDEGYFVPSPLFWNLVRWASGRVHIDEDWYVQRYQDVKKAIVDQKFSSAREHYATHGFFEGRQPFPITVDAAFYLKKYPDVAKAVRRGAFETAQHHYDTLGFSEGREPYEGFDLSRHRR